MSNAGRHLSEGAEFFSAKQQFLRRVQVVECLLQLLVLVRLVETDGGKLRQRFNRHPVFCAGRSRLDIHRHERSEQPGIADQRKDAEPQPSVFASFYHDGSQFRQGVHALQIEGAQFGIARPVRGHRTEVALIVHAKDKGVQSAALIHDRLRKERGHAFGRCRIGDKLRELDQC